MRTAISQPVPGMRGSGSSSSSGHMQAARNAPPAHWRAAGSTAGSCSSSSSSSGPASHRHQGQPIELCSAWRGDRRPGWRIHHPCVQSKIPAPFPVHNKQVVRVQPCRATSGQKASKGRWRSMDAGVDSSDDQVRVVSLSCWSRQAGRACNSTQPTAALQGCNPPPPHPLHTPSCCHHHHHRA
jgi:hypothetical protein